MANIKILQEIIHLRSPSILCGPIDTVHLGVLAEASLCDVGIRPISLTCNMYTSRPDLRHTTRKFEHYNFRFTITPEDNMVLKLKNIDINRMLSELVAEVQSERVDIAEFVDGVFNHSGESK